MRRKQEGALTIQKECEILIEQQLTLSRAFEGDRETRVANVSEVLFGKYLTGR